MFGTLKRYFFASTTNYFLKLGADAEFINKLSVNALLSLLPDSAGLADWIKKNKINIRREEDLIALIEHWNQANAIKR